jgi:hypothetical protein
MVTWNFVGTFDDPAPAWVVLISADGSKVMVISTVSAAPEA